MSKKIGFIPVITILRGIAALMVCLYHFVCTTSGYFQDETVLGVFKYGKFGVHVFFVISGVVLPLSMLNSNYKFSSWNTFLVRRIVRIEPPYIAALILGVIYMSIRSYLPSSNDVDLIPSFRDVILHVGYLVPFFEDSRWLNGAFWTLAIEFQYYILLIILFPLMTHKKTVYRMCFYGFFLTPPLFFVLPAFFIHWASLFLIGILYVLNRSKKIDHIEYKVMMVVTLFVISYTLSYTSSIVAVLTLVVIHFLSNYTNKILNFFGDISYSLYLVHGITGAAIINVLSHRFTEPYQKPIVVLVGLILSIICAYIMYRIVEKPFQKIASSIKYSKK